MNIAALLCVLVAQFLAGNGILRLFKLRLDALPAFSMSLILGVAALSFTPCILQLAHVPITSGSVLTGLIVTTVLCSIPQALYFRTIHLGKIPRPGLYELPFLIVFFLFIVISAFRCFYFPPSPRDVLAGSELIAEFTIREKTMVNSIYSVDLHTTNNQFKSPFLTSLQIIYKLYVCPFGSAWLTSLFVAFVVFLYAMLKDRVHGLIACSLLLLYFCVPDAFAYSYIILYDYSNMIFFFTGFYFLSQHILHKRKNDFAFSVLLFGIATYIRVETLVLVGFVALMPAWYSYRAKEKVSKILINGAILMACSAFFYFLCMNVFVALFVPQKMDTMGMVNKNLADISAFFTRMSSVNDDLIFSAKGVLVYGYFLYYFIALLLLDLVFVRKFNQEARMALYGVAVVYFGLIFLGYLLPLFDVMNTTKRGMFKALPLILYYFANSGILLKISNYLTARENRPQTPVAAAKTAPAPTARPNTKNRKKA